MTTYKVVRLNSNYISVCPNSWDVIEETTSLEEAISIATQARVDGRTCIHCSDDPNKIIYPALAQKRSDSYIKDAISGLHKHTSFKYSLLELYYNSEAEFEDDVKRLFPGNDRVLTDAMAGREEFIKNL